MTAKNPLIWQASFFSELTSLQQMQFSVGAVGTPGITFRGDNATGIYYVATSIRISVSGTLVASYSAAGEAITGAITATTSIDAGTIYSIGGNTVIDANRLVLLRNYIVSGLPASPPDGATAFVTDSTQTLTAGIGTPVVGGSTNKVPVYAASTVWLIG